MGVQIFCLNFHIEIVYPIGRQRSGVANGLYPIGDSFPGPLFSLLLYEGEIVTVLGVGLCFWGNTVGLLVCVEELSEGGRLCVGCAESNSRW